MAGKSDTCAYTGNRAVSVRLDVWLVGAAILERSRDCSDRFESVAMRWFCAGRL